MGPGLTETFETPTILRELNDVVLFVAKSLSGDEFYRAVIDQFDQLYEDSAQSGRVLALALHPFVIGQPLRIKYLTRALQYIASHERVWLTTSDDIAAHHVATSSTGA
jgi:peptidoglycan/xylan/chitin deacetylase (PgdA/CDA1 family)